MSHVAVKARTPVRTPVAINEPILPRWTNQSTVPTDAPALFDDEPTFPRWFLCVVVPVWGAAFGIILTAIIIGFLR